MREGDVDVMAEVRRFVADDRAVERRQPSVLEVGTFAAQMLRDEAEAAGHSLPGVVSRLWGIPVVERQDVPPGRWRMLDEAGGVLHEGNMAEGDGQPRTL